MNIYDNSVRKAVFDGYQTLNIVSVYIDLGYNTFLKTNVKLNGVYVTDSDSAKRYFENLVDADVLLKNKFKPDNQQFFLVEMFVDRNDGSGSFLDINQDMIDKGIAKRWSAEDVKSA